MSGPRPAGLLLEAGLVLAWSSGFIGAKLAAETPSIFLVLFWRFAIVTALLLPLAAWRWRAAFSRRRVARQMLVGALAMFGYLAFGLKAIELGVSAGTAALISALQPLATAALAGPILGDVVRGRQWLGLAVGLGGLALAVGGGLGGAPLWASGLCLISVASLVAATLLAKAAPQPMPLVPALGIQGAVSALLFAPLAVFEGGLAPSPDAAFRDAVAWFVLFSTLGGYGLYWLCLRRSSATRVGTLIYLTPPVTMIWAAAMFGEPLTATAVGGFALCLIGVALAADGRARGAPPRAPD